MFSHFCGCFHVLFILSDLDGGEASDALNKKIAQLRATCPGDELPGPMLPTVCRTAGGTVVTQMLGGLEFHKCVDGFGTILCPLSLEMMRLKYMCNKFMYEVTVATGKTYQIGWSTPNQQWGNGNGVGDFPMSFGIDGSRDCFWKNGIRSACAQTVSWTAGDVVGCCVDMTDSNNTQLTFYRNGMIVNKPERIGPYGSTKDLVPALTMSVPECAHVNLGLRPFMFVIVLSYIH